MTGDAMNIVFLSQRFLLPMDAGGKIRTGKILEQLAQQHSITIVSNVEFPQDEPYQQGILRLCTRFIPVRWTEIKKHSPLFLLRLIPQLFSRYPVSVLNSSSRKLRLAVEQELSTGNYDVAICDFAQSALEFRKIRTVPTILFQHNVEAAIARRHLEQSGNALAKLFWWLQWKKMSAFEARACQRFDTVIAVSENDKTTFECLYQAQNVVTIPTGVDTDFFHPTPDVPEDDVNVAFCGSLDWLPNEDAARFYIHEILPLIQQQIPAVTFTVVGKNPSPALQKLVQDHPEVTLTGWVDDTRPYLARSAVVIVPLRIGGGTRMKIYEAMAMGKPVVSTTIGAEGLPVTHNENILIADSPEVFAEKLLSLLRDSQTRRQIGRHARTFVEEHFAWKYVAREFSRICSMTIDANSGR